MLLFGFTSVVSYSRNIYFQSQMSLSEQTEEGSLAASHLDSCYFAPASQLPTPLHEDNGSIDYESM